MVKIPFLRGLLICMISTVSSAYATIDASLNRNSMQLGETVQLTVSIDDTRFFGSPDISSLNDQFDILGQQKSSQTSIINGKRTSITKWMYVLSPKSVGLLTIVGIKIDDQASNPIALKVENSNTATQSGNEPVFMQATLSKQESYVQEQVLLTLHINSSINLQDIQLQSLQIDNATITQLSNTSYEKQINGTPYTTYEVVYAITPQLSGTITIPSIKAEGISPDSNFNRLFNGGRRISIQTQALSLKVKASPQTATNQAWLPANDLQLHETWSNDPENISVGDSITRTLQITAMGLNAKQLPELNMQSSDYFKVYQDKASENDTKNEQGVVSEKKQAITLVATNAGTVTLPAITIEWWDIQSNTFKKASLAAVTLHIKDNATSSQPTMTAQTNTTTLPNSATAPTTNTEKTIKTITNHNNENVLLWQIIAAINAIIAILFAALWLNTRNHNKDNFTPQKTASINNTVSNPLSDLKDACNNKQATAIKVALMTWAKAEYPTHKIHSLIDIQQLINNDQLSMWLSHLDKALYQNDNTPREWLDLYKIIAQLNDKVEKKDKALPPLYPNN